MEKYYLAPSILHLTGVTLKDYIPIEDVADEKVLDAANSDEPADEQYGGSADQKGSEKGISESIIPYDKIPRVFTTLEEWPLRTNLRCYEYGFTFDDRPKFIPTYLRMADDGTCEIGVYGNFCTFNAAALHINTTIHNRDERFRMQDMLKFVYTLFTGKTVSHIEPGPKKYELAAYGGSWDEDTLWKKLRELDPAHGLRDHTPGSVLTERERMGVSARKTGMLPVKEGESVWNVCRRAVGAPAVESLENQSVAIEFVGHIPQESPHPDNVDTEGAVVHTGLSDVYVADEADVYDTDETRASDNHENGQVDSDADTRSADYLDSIIAGMITS